MAKSRRNHLKGPTDQKLPEYKFVEYKEPKWKIKKSKPYQSKISDKFKAAITDPAELKAWEDEIRHEHMLKRVRRRDAARAGDDFTGLGSMFNMDGHENCRAALARGRYKWQYGMTTAQRSAARKAKRHERLKKTRAKRDASKMSKAERDAERERKKNERLRNRALKAGKLTTTTMQI